MLKLLLSLFFFLFTIAASYSQNLESIKIKIVSDNESANADLVGFEQRLKEEITTLLTNRKTPFFSTEYCGSCDLQKLNDLFDAAYNDPLTDIVIAVGAMSSAVLAQRTVFPKPSIAGIIIDNELQGVPMTEDEKSGIKNFTYVQSPFSFENDLALLYELYPFTNLGVIGSNELQLLFPNLQDLFRNSKLGQNIQFTPITAGSTADQTLNKISTDIDAVYVFPFFGEFADSEYAGFFTGLTEKQLPSVALLGENMVALGALSGYLSETNLTKMPRRIALDVSKIANGIDAAELPVLINTFSETAIINMNTARKIDVYPNWDLATEAILLNANQIESDRNLSLESTILEALERNLTLKIAGVNPLLAQREVELARSELLPQLDVNSSLLALDQNTTDGAFGTKGRLNWTVGSSLSQVVYAEPALANMTIQKFLQKGEEAGLQATQLDIVFDAANSFLSVLQAKSFLEVQAANVGVTKNNLDIAKAKDAVGYSGATDLNRWKAELAVGKIDMNDAQAQYRQAKYALNQFLNRPTSEGFNVEEISLKNSLLLVTDLRMIDRINNEKELELLADFLVEEAMNNLPELQQIDYGLAAQERLLQSQKRAFYLPTLGFSGGLDHTLKRWDATPPGPGVELPELKPTWNLGLGVQYPILLGGQRRLNQQTTELNILQTNDQLANTKNQLDLRVRSALQNAAASYFSVLRYNEAREASAANFTIVQDAYSQGLTSVTNLVDAQNAKVQTELGLVNATYQFILDFLAVERSIGFYYQLASKAERDAFFERMTAFMMQKK